MPRLSLGIGLSLYHRWGFTVNASRSMKNPIYVLHPCPSMQAPLLSPLLLSIKLASRAKRNGRWMSTIVLFPLRTGKYGRSSRQTKKTCVWLRSVCVYFHLSAFPPARYCTQGPNAVNKYIISAAAQCTLYNRSVGGLSPWSTTTRKKASLFLMQRVSLTLVAAI